MIQASDSGLQLECAMGKSVLTDCAEINHVLAPFGSKIWSLSLEPATPAVHKLVQKTSLTVDENEAVKVQLLFSRERLLDTIEQAGRTPQIPGGGQLSTLDRTHDVTYPQLYVVSPDIDYTRFDRFHVNVAPDGTGVDEVMHVLWGSGVKLLQHLPEHGLVSLDINCIDQNSGWTLTYDGAYPHIGSISGGVPGTKVLMQVIGPAQWDMVYEDSVDSP